MKVDYALVLAAGKGTRMGSIGKLIPKVIWPVFEKSILELETLYCKDFGAQKIFVNLFNFKDKISTSLSKTDQYNKINIIIEDEELDIGGAIHNLASKLNYKGKLLIANSDQFIMLSDNVKESFLKASDEHDVVLLTYDVEGKELYNGVESINNRVTNFKQNSEYGRDEKFETYTGMSIVNLESLSPIEGKSKFFDTVANLKQLNVGRINIQDSKYWDFGTVKRYYKSMFNILKAYESNDPFINFLKKNNAIDSSKVSKNSYGTNIHNSIDLGKNIKVVKNTIYLTKYTSEVLESDCIVFNDEVELVN
jgi:mannose-1-phosphate guanylyltransferase